MKPLSLRVSMCTTMALAFGLMSAGYAQEPIRAGGQAGANAESSGMDATTAKGNRRWINFLEHLSNHAVQQMLRVQSKFILVDLSTTIAVGDFDHPGIDNLLKQTGGDGKPEVRLPKPELKSLYDLSDIANALYRQSQAAANFTANGGPDWPDLGQTFTEIEGALNNLDRVRKEAQRRQSGLFFVVENYLKVIIPQHLASQSRVASPTLTQNIAQLIPNAALQRASEVLNDILVIFKDGKLDHRLTYDLYDVPAQAGKPAKPGWDTYFGYKGYDVNRR